VTGAICAINPNNLIIVGTPNWSQNVDEASLDPITHYPNIAYMLHFYSGSHQQWLCNKAQTALNRNIALYVTKWGSVNADGNGGVNVGKTRTWVNLMKRNHIINANWALNDKVEGASAFIPGASTTGNWGDGQLTTSGKLACKITRGWPGNRGPPSPPPPTPTCPTPATSPTTITVAPECYQWMQGKETEDTSDVGGGKNVGYIDTGDWMAYPEVSIRSTGAYRVEYQVASGSSGGSLQLEKAGGTPVYGTVSIQNMGGWKNWQTFLHTVNLNAGLASKQLEVVGTSTGSISQ
jgi:endoglucanase